MNSVATEIVSLFELSGLSDLLRRDSAVFDARHLFETRNGSGTITLDVSEHECLVVTRITLDNVDWTLAATMAVELRGRIVPPLSTPLEAIEDEPLLLVFEQGRLVFTFNVVEVLGSTARITLQGARLPREAATRLKQLATKLA